MIPNWIIYAIEEHVSQSGTLTRPVRRDFCACLLTYIHTEGNRDIFIAQEHPS